MIGFWSCLWTQLNKISSMRMKENLKIGARGGEMSDKSRQKVHQLKPIYFDSSHSPPFNLSMHCTMNVSQVSEMQLQSINNQLNWKRKRKKEKKED